MVKVFVPQDTGLGCLCDAQREAQRKAELAPRFGAPHKDPSTLLAAWRAVLPPPPALLENDIYLPIGKSGLCPTMTSLCQRAMVPTKIQRGKIVFLAGAVLKAGTALDAQHPVVLLLDALAASIAASATGGEVA